MSTLDTIRANCHSKAVRSLLVVLIFVLSHYHNSHAGDLLPPVEGAQQAVRIGVLAYRGKPHALQRWQKTIDYLSSKLPKYRIKLIPLTLQEMRKRVAAAKLEFVITNTGQYVEFEFHHGVSRIATLVNKRLGKSTTRFGAVIFVRADNRTILTLHDLKGKSFMGVNETGFGGFRMAWRELHEHGIDPYSDFSRLEFSGFPQVKVLDAVLQGKVDAGTFRSDSLERLAAKGKITFSQIRVLNEKFTPGFPFRHSTRVYPEWPFAKLKHTPEKLSKRVAMLLLTIEENSSAAINATSSGWTVPLNYQPVHALMQELNVGPYKELTRVSWHKVMLQYGHWIVIIMLAVCAIGILSFRVHRLNGKLKDTNRVLQNEVQHRIQIADAMEYQAMHDALTGILNRHAFNKMLKNEIHRARRYQSQFAVVVLDLDDFKDINDSYGHQVGDIYLIQFAQRIKNILRTSDAMARIGGDEFAIISLDVNTPSDVAVLSRRINKENERPYRVDNMDLHSSVSLGAAIYGMHGESEEQLLHHADVQMYEHKKSHKLMRRA